MKTQLVGPLSFRGMNMTADEFEYMLGKVSSIAQNYISINC